MAAEVPDEVLTAFAAIGTYDEIVTKVEERFGDISDSVILELTPGTPTGEARELLQDLKKIPSHFEGFSASW